MALSMLLIVACALGVLLAVPLVSWQARVRDVAVIVSVAWLLSAAYQPADAALALVYLLLAGVGSAAVTVALRRGALRTSRQ